jgi:trk/ktr system potassium uptake protein
VLIKPVRRDFEAIGHNLGRVFTVVGVAGFAPAIWAALSREWHPLSSFLLMIGFFLVLGQLGVRLPYRGEVDRLAWSHGMVVVALTWLLVPLIGAIPFMLSGHYASPLDSYFDAMSGLSTTGLSLVQDLDHLATSLNFWRHLLHFLGGQGIIIAALVLFAGRGNLTLYYGEARDEKILPSVKSTARFIWAVSLVHLVAGVAALGFVAWQVLGFSPTRSLFHGLMIFFAGFDTGGFTPQSTSIAYYHSAIFEATTAVLMIAGAMSFGVHFALWRRRTRSVMENLETRTILSTLGLTMIVTMAGLAATGVYSTVFGLGRQAMFQVVSAHSGTGFATVTPTELGSWGGLAFGGIVIAMALGGMGSSTAGGVKALRVGLTIRAIGNQIKQVLLAEGAVARTSYMQGSRKQLTPELAQSAMTVSLLYVALFGLGTGVALMYGYPLQTALFESVSAGASVGLSAGITDVSMPALLKVTYIGQMWLGRLEFVAIFALFGFIVSWLRGK